MARKKRSKFKKKRSLHVSYYSYEATRRETQIIMVLCAYPINLEKVGGIVPCGQCNPCRQNRRRQKTGRLVLEASQHEHSLS